MKNLTIIFSGLLIFTVFALPTSAQNENRAIEGNWLGALDVGGIKMRLVLKVAKTVDGYTAKLDSIDQGVKDLPVDTVTLAGDKMNFSAAQFGMSYEGAFNEKGDEINGTFKQGAGSTPFVFRRIAEIPKNKRLQDPTGPYPYSEEEVGYKNVKDNVKLAGTLSVPPGEG
ncbi:MAG: alpha/beta hydrolase, partial [Pyrinomonadaceae bacterium]